MRCAAYRALNWVKKTPFALPFYGFKRFQQFGPIAIAGTLCRCNHKSVVRVSTDGDECFDIITSSGKRWHCEVTPCSPAAFRAMTSRLPIGARLVVRGTQAYDPNHSLLPFVGIYIKGLLFRGGKDEIHPVTGIDVLT